MDRRSWPWKKKTSDKSAAEKVFATLDSAGASLPSGQSQTEKDDYKKTTYVQISVESYTHLTGLENQVKIYEEHIETTEEQVKAYEDQVIKLEGEIDELNEKLSSANSEITTKEELVKQHAKVAEEAVSGWEKAETEALAVKNHLESVTLAKLTVEDRAAHLDGALKECMRQIRNLKEEHEQKLQELVQKKNRQFDSMKHELESRITGFDQELMRCRAENSAVSQSLHERSNMLIKINEEKSRAEAEIELMKNNVESCEREINSLKYELHIVSKELEIRNEEKNMCAKTAEAATKQHMESVKKVTKLEAECQRLRGLVRKKLPGPAALAQMKMEVENLGRDHGDSRIRRSPIRPDSPQYSTNPHMLPVPEFSLDGVQKFQKENDFLTDRLLAMEEETKMLKEALAKRNSELQTSRSICAKTASKLQSLEAQLQILNQQRGFPKSEFQVQAERSSSQHVSSPPSMASFSEDGNDDTVSCAESWASALISELSHNKGKSKDKPKPENGNHLELMDDFEEMEKLARLSNHSTGTNIISGGLGKEKPSERVNESDSLANNSFDASELKLDTESLPLVKLQSRISKVFESASKESDMVKNLEDIKHAVQEVHSSLHPHSVSCVFEEKHCSDGTNSKQTVSENVVITDEKDIGLAKIDSPSEAIERIGEKLVVSISQIHDFILWLGKEATVVRGESEDGERLGHKIEKFSATFNRVLFNETSVDDFLFALSDIIMPESELHFSFLGYKGSKNDAEAISPDCIDKVALPENKLRQAESYSNGCGHISDSSSNPEVPQEANILSGSCKFTLEEFENIKAEKDDMERELLKCTQELGTVRSQLQEAEQLLREVKSELSSSQKINSLAETQLKCMAESYKTLEKRAEQLENEVNVLKEKLSALVNELAEEKKSHLDALSRCEDLEEHLQRNEECPMCSSSAADVDVKAKQEMELAAAAEKLAECQETIFLLGKQMKSFRPQPEFSERSQKGEVLNEEEEEEEPTISSGTNLLNLEQVAMDTATSCTYLTRQGSESPLDIYNTPYSPSETESGNPMKSPVGLKNTRHRPTKSGSSTSSTPTPEKLSRGFSRFFSPKAKNSH